MVEIDSVTLAIVSGLVLPLVQGAFDQIHWTANRRRLVTIVAAIVLGAGIWWQQGHPTQWEAIVAQVTVVLGVAQTTFTLLKQWGVIDWVGRVTPGGEENTPAYTPRHQG